MFKRTLLSLIGFALVLQGCDWLDTNSGASTQFCAQSIYFVEIIENGDIGGLEPAQCKQKAEFSDGKSYKYENYVKDAEEEAANDSATQGKNVVWGPRAENIPWCVGKKPTHPNAFEDDNINACGYEP